MNYPFKLNRNSLKFHNIYATLSLYELNEHQVNMYCYLKPILLSQYDTKETMQNKIGILL